MVTRVLVFGATSRVGPEIVKALLTSPSIETTLILRPSSKAPPSYPGAKHLVLPSDLPTISEYTNAFKGYDVLVSALGRQTFDLQCELSDICVGAGIKKYILADYGSVSSDDLLAKEYLALYAEKARVREYADQVAKKKGNEGFSWTSLITGHFFDYGLKSELLGFNLDEGRADLFDGGKMKWSSSTLEQIGKSVLLIITISKDQEDGVKNKLLYIQSFIHSQLDILHSIEKVTGEKLKRIEKSTEEWLGERKEKAKNGDADAIEEIVEVLGMTRSNWLNGPIGTNDFANDLLGLKEENLDKVVRQVLGNKTSPGGYCVIA